MGWANKIVGWTDNTGTEVNSEGALYTVPLNASGNHYTVVGRTGTMAAALAANSTIFAMRFDPAATKNAWIDSVRLRWTTIVAFTTPVTATRALSIVRGNGAATSGGASIPVADKKDSNYSASEFDLALGGDIRIATTGALTVTGITFETTYFADIPLIHVGTAGAYYETVYEYSVRNRPIELHAGELIAIRNGATAMDAAGTWVLSVEVNWRESTSEA